MKRRKAYRKKGKHAGKRRVCEKNGKCIGKTGKHVGKRKTCRKKGKHIGRRGKRAGAASPRDLVAQLLAGDDGDLLAHPLVGVEVVAQPRVVLLDDDPRRLLHRLRPNASLGGGRHRSLPPQAPLPHHHPPPAPPGGPAASTPLPAAPRGRPRAAGPRMAADGGGLGRMGPALTMSAAAAQRERGRRGGREAPGDAGSGRRPQRPLAARRSWAEAGLSKGAWFGVWPRPQGSPGSPRPPQRLPCVPSHLAPQGAHPTLHPKTLRCPWSQPCCVPPPSPSGDSSPIPKQQRGSAQDSLFFLLQRVYYVPKTTPQLTPRICRRVQSCLHILQ